MLKCENCKRLIKRNKKLRRLLSNARCNWVLLNRGIEAISRMEAEQKVIAIRMFGRETEIHEAIHDLLRTIKKPDGHLYDATVPLWVLEKFEAIVGKNMVKNNYKSK